MSEFSRLDIHEGWAEIVIERPDRRNSLIPPLAGEICGYLELLNENDNISAIVLRGKEDTFAPASISKLYRQTLHQPGWEKMSGMYDQCIWHSTAVKSRSLLL
jgi:enoyl-CoA hydratase/carnithine racemase